MQTIDRTGIICDQCGMTHKTDFKYYSFEFRKVSAYQNRRPALEQILRLPIEKSLDICTSCFDKIKRVVVANYSKTMTDNVKHRGKHGPGIVCEISGTKLVGDYDYYHCNIIYAVIRMTGQPSICVKCNTKTFDKTKPCSKCSSSNYTSIANVTTDDRYLEINVSEQEFQKMIDKADDSKRSAEWSTSS